MAAAIKLLQLQLQRPVPRQQIIGESSCFHVALQQPQAGLACSQRPLPPTATMAACAAAPAAATRRRVLALLPPLALLSGAWEVLPARAEDGYGDEDAGEDGSTSDFDASFYSKWPYVQPADILPYLRATARRGDPDSVLAAIDTFASYYPMYRQASPLLLLPPSVAANNCIAAPCLSGHQLLRPCPPRCSANEVPQPCKDTMY
jgi:hypothetical protein